MKVREGEGKAARQVKGRRGEKGQCRGGEERIGAVERRGSRGGEVKVGGEVRIDERRRGGGVKGDERGPGEEDARSGGKAEGE